MTIHLPKELELALRAEVRDGRYDSLDAAVAHAVRLLLSRRPQPPGKPLSEQELEQRLIESGLLGSVPPPLDPAEPPWSFEPVTIEGEPLSETVIRERR